MQIQKETAHSVTNAPPDTQITDDNDTPSAKGVNQIVVSLFKGAKSTDPRDVTIGQLLAAIRTGKTKDNLRQQIEQIRDKHRYGDENAKKLAGELKLQLPAVTFSGVFTERNNGALRQHSGLLCADLDKLGDSLPNVREALKKSPYVWALFVSPSGYGLKAVFRVPSDAAKHAGSFRAVEKHVKEATGVQVDQACKDVARLCFISYDPQLYVNENAIEIQPLPEPEKPKPLSNGEIDLNERQRIATEILGEVDWESDTSGLISCPGKHLHTNGNGARDCKVELDNVPTVHCFHNSCRGIVEGVNHALRSGISKAEYVPDKTASPGNTSGTSQDSPISVDVDAGESSRKANPYASPPLDLLPKKLQDYVRAAANSLNVDVSFVLLPMLSSLGSTIGNARSILLKPGFIQPPVIWTGIWRNCRWSHRVTASPSTTK
jgi:VirE N-terminal domain